MKKQDNNQDMIRKRTGIKPYPGVDEMARTLRKYGKLGVIRQVEGTSDKVATMNMVRDIFFAMFPDKSIKELKIEKDGLMWKYRAVSHVLVGMQAEVSAVVGAEGVTTFYLHIRDLNRS